jgi:hypothetical protein
MYAIIMTTLCISSLSRYYDHVIMYVVIIMSLCMSSLLGHNVCRHYKSLAVFRQYHAFMYVVIIMYLSMSLLSHYYVCFRTPLQHSIITQKLFVKIIK